MSPDLETYKRVEYAYSPLNAVVVPFLVKTMRDLFGKKWGEHAVTYMAPLGLKAICPYQTVLKYWNDFEVVFTQKTPAGLKTSFDLIAEMEILITKSDGDRSIAPVAGLKILEAFYDIAKALGAPELAGLYDQLIEELRKVVLATT